MLKNNKKFISLALALAIFTSHASNKVHALSEGQAIFLGFMTMVSLPTLIAFSPSIWQKIKDAWQVSRANPSNAEETLFELRCRLASEVIGQKKAKKEIFQRVYSFLRDPDPSGALVLCLNGGPGLGKTYAARIIQKVVLGGGSVPSIISSSSVDNSSKTSAVKQIFELKTNAFGQTVTTTKHEFLVQIEANPKSVFIFDEFDKFDSSMRSLIWDARDTGFILAGGKKYDLRGSIIIIMTNYSRESLRLAPDLNETKEIGNALTNSELPIPFIQRIMPIQFERFSSEEFGQIIDFEISKFKNYYEEKFNLILSVQNRLKKKWSEEFAKDPYGNARTVLKKLDIVRYKLERFRVKNGINSKQENQIKILIKEFKNNESGFKVDFVKK